MTSTHRKRKVWTAVSLLTLVGSASAVYLVAPAEVIDVKAIADLAHCQSRVLLTGAPSASCGAAGNKARVRDEAAALDPASAISLQAQGRSIGEAFGASHR